MALVTTIRVITILTMVITTKDAIMHKKHKPTIAKGIVMNTRKRHTSMKRVSIITKVITTTTKDATMLMKRKLTIVKTTTTKLLRLTRVAITLMAKKLTTMMVTITKAIAMKQPMLIQTKEIGRASCRERVFNTV